MMKHRGENQPMRFRIFALFTVGLLTVSSNAFPQFRPNLPQFDNGANLGSFVQGGVKNDGWKDGYRWTPLSTGTSTKFSNRRYAG
jgi:hypothetical protein